MRVGLNLLHLQPEIGGGWNYITRLVRALSIYETSNTYIAFVTNKSLDVITDTSNVKVVSVNIDPVFRAKRVFYENSFLQLSALKYQLDIIHWFAATYALANTVPGVVSFYDLQVFEEPNTFTFMKRLYLRIMMTNAARRAALLLPMSHATEFTLNQILNVAKERMSVVPAIVTSSFQPVALTNQVIDFLQRYSLPQQFWLYVAHFYPHKNHKRLLQAYHLLKLEGFSVWPLVLRGNDHGAQSEVMETIVQLGLHDDVRFLPPLVEQELPLLYSAASALVFPSLYEGGAMPILEAMACGCPFIASDIPLHREYRGEVITLFDPMNLRSIATVMKMFQEDSLYRCCCREFGLKRILEHRPEQVSQTLAQAYSKVSAIKT